MAAEGSDYQKLRTEKENYAALLAKNLYERRKEKLANVAEADARQRARERALARRVLAIPDSIAARLAADDDARNCEDMIEEALRHVLAPAEQMLDEG